MRIALGEAHEFDARTPSAVQQKPTATASVFQGRRRSFLQLQDRIARFAGALQRCGVRPYDRIAMLAHNSDRYLEFYLAVYWAGAVATPINFRWSADEVAYALNDCGATVLIVDDAFAEIAARMRVRARSLKAIIHAGDDAAPAGLLSYEALLANSAPVDDARRAGDDLAAIFYTGGTTGAPKGVMLSHANLYCNALCALAEGNVTDDSVGLHAAPMFHLADGALLTQLLMCGGRHVIIPAFSPLAFLQAVETQAATDSVLVPTMIQAIVDHPDVHRYDLKRLRRLIYAASPISETLIRRAIALMPSTAFAQAYGMTELSPVATMLPPAYHTPEGLKAEKIRSAGRASYTADVRIADSNDAEVPRGTIGEILVRGPGVMLGYWNRPDETAAALRGGWMHTGDLGYMDEDGFVFVVDRLKDMIISGGENIYSTEVEAAIAQHPAVASCAVIGVPDPKWGECVQAFVVRKPSANANEHDIIEHCKSLIAAFKCPRSVEFRDSLPLSGAGKILKSELRQAYWNGMERQVS